MKTAEKGRGGRRWEAGAELVEFALVVPVLLVLVMGIVDFGAAFGQRAKLTQAAREAARIMVSSPLTDQSCSTATPCAVVASATAVVNYLSTAGMNLSCIQPGSPTSTGTLSWTYSCANGTSLTINAGYTYTSADGTLVQATQVLISYPVQLRLAGLLPGFGKYTTISTQVAMVNL